jgi:hypothetical protein
VKFITAFCVPFYYASPVAIADTNYHIGPSMITRRQYLKRLLGVGAATMAAPIINRGWFQLFAESTTKYSARAIDLVQRGTIVDMLNPFTLLGVLAPFKRDKRPTWFTNPETFTAADFQRFKDSRIDAIAAIAPRSMHSKFPKPRCSSLMPIAARLIPISQDAKPMKRSARWQPKEESWVSLASVISFLPGNQLR